MALTFHTYKFLEKVKSDIDKFGDVLSLGRVNNLIHKDDYSALSIEKSDEIFADNILLKNFNIKSIQSLDFSKFEDADIIHDLNLPIKNFKETFDTVLDLGTSEHIFNIIQNLKNISYMTKINGIIIHCLPANNNCGHGFWQFSPEFFFNLYQKKNGFDQTVIYLVNRHDKKNWYKINKQNSWERLELNSKESIYIFIKTRKIGQTNFDNIYQSDYKFLWSKEKEIKKQNKFYLSILNKKIKNSFKSFLRNSFFSKKIFTKFENTKNYNKKYFKKNKNFEKIKI